MRLYRFFLGTDTNGADVNAKQLALDLAAKYFPAGHTVSDTIGRWIGEVGVIDEATIVVDWLTELDAPECEIVAKDFAGDYKQQANQEAVLVTFFDVSAVYV